MFVLDRMLIGGLAFVLDKIAVAAGRELDDEPALHERLLAAQMQLELGEIDEAAFREIEAEVVERLRALRAQREAEGAAEKVVGATVETQIDDDR